MTYLEHHIEVLLLANISDIYNPLSFLLIKSIRYKMDERKRWITKIIRLLNSRFVKTTNQTNK